MGEEAASKRGIGDMKRWSMLKANPRHKVFFRLLVPYLLFLLFFMIIGWIIYGRTFTQFENEAIKGNRTLLEQSKDTLDRRLTEIDMIVQQMVSNPKVMQLQHVAAPFEGANTYRVLDTRNQLQDTTLFNNFILDYYILYQKSGLAMSPDTVYKLPQFYEQVLRYGGMTYEEWYERVMGPFHSKAYIPAQEVRYRDAPASMVTYLQSLGYAGFPQGVITVLIDNEEIRKLLKGLDISDGGGAYILDDKGQIISSVTSEPKAALPVPLAALSDKSGVIRPSGASGHMITYTTSDYNGWTYVAAQPSHIVLQKVNYIKKMFFTIFFVTLFIGMLLAYLLAYRNSKPLRAIVSTITGRPDGSAPPQGDVYRFIRDSVSRLIDRNRTLEDEIQAQIPFLRASFIERLLKGEIAAQKDNRPLHVGLDMNGAYFAAAILQLRGYGTAFHEDILDEMDVERIMVKERLRETLQDNGYLHDAAEDRIVILFVLREPDRGAAEALLERLSARMDEEMGRQLQMAPTLAVGGLCDSLSGLARSYEEAKQALVYSHRGNGFGRIHYRDCPRGGSGFHYPADVESRLMNCAAAGDDAEVRKLLEELYRENFNTRHLAVPMLKLFIHEMWGTLVKLYIREGWEADGPFEDDFAAWSGPWETYGELENSYAGIRARYGKVCDYVKDHKKSSNLRLLEDIKRVLHAAYGQNELCLDLVADRMGISKVYLSHFFKEQTGVNFSDYLEGLRMEEAVRLLLHTDRSVHEIAAAAGYGSMNTFGRAFKRIHGITPTVYRETRGSK